MTDQVSLREQLLQGAQTSGAFLFLGNPDIAEIMGIAGFPVLIVDREHAAADHASALAELRAIRSVCDAHVLIRTKDDSPAALKPMLDAGFDGVVIADVRSTTQAAKIVETCRYAPLGRRGAQFTVSRAANYGEDPHYAKNANRRLLVSVMLECQSGLDAIEDIGKLPGIDMLFLGPLDLTTDIGRFGDLNHPNLQQALANAERRILATGKCLGGAALPGESPLDLQKRGYHLVSHTSDVSLLRAGAASVVQPNRP
ncbi:aldolase/citrate lyase family protein [uncultured Shimia sp.]|uniref:HpcH/HpaI aldolase family protein n=1 Tax=uncultured Shimia sp. TaxID=573152 RepID=UPI0026238BA6|nr:aldolase/citrate lyase family protein [uncultured Shimia sp.]